MTKNNFRYWEQETPKTIATKNYQLAFYAEAGILQVSRLTPAGKVCKAVGMNVAELRGNTEIKTFFDDILR